MTNRLTFEGGVAHGVGDFRKSEQTDFEETNSCKEIPGEQNFYTEKMSFMAYNSEEKILDPCV